MVNPSAAGTQRGTTGTTAPKPSVKDDAEHGGSKPMNANTHPLAALKAHKQMQKQGRSLPPSSRARPAQTTDPAAGH
jgi:hypothetical protein